MNIIGTKTIKGARHALAIALLPFVVTFVIPRWLAATYGVTFVVPPSLAGEVAVALGVGLFLMGAALAVTSVFRFATDGDGTLAPWDPPRYFVASGPYRYVRNPMITGVCMVLCAQTLILRSTIHGAWALVFLAINAVYIPLIEEPQLRRRFGSDYDAYCAAVGRLLPRLTPYAAPAHPRTGAPAQQFSAVIPAAGRSLRFGSDKRLALIDGVPMLERVTATLRDAGATPVIVVRDNPDLDRGMFSTIQIGLAQAVDAQVAVILVQPADMPFVRPETIRIVAAHCARTGEVVCPRFNGKRGHPIAIPIAVANALLNLEPSTPLNQAFAHLGLARTEIDVDDAGVLRDVDRPQDLR